MEKGFMFEMEVSAGFVTCNVVCSYHEKGRCLLFGEKRTGLDRVKDCIQGEKWADAAGLNKDRMQSDNILILCDGKIEIDDHFTDNCSEECDGFVPAHVFGTGEKNHCALTGVDLEGWARCKECCAAVALHEKIVDGTNSEGDDE